jgi:hypothetical protein
MTTRTSNIIEDLEVIRILNRVISEICVSSIYNINIFSQRGNNQKEHFRDFARH